MATAAAVRAEVDAERAEKMKKIDGTTATLASLSATQIAVGVAVDEPQRQLSFESTHSSSCDIPPPHKHDVARGSQSQGNSGPSVSYASESIAMAMHSGRFQCYNCPAQYSGECEYCPACGKRSG